MAGSQAEARVITGIVLADGKPVFAYAYSNQLSTIDETFAIGEDRGTPVVGDYADKMPFRFTGKRKKFVVILEPEMLTEEEPEQLLEEEAQACLSVH